MASIRPLERCISKLSILKWLQLICSLAVIIFINDGRHQWFIYTAIFFITIILIVLTILTLVLQCMDLKNLHNVEVIFNLLAFLFCLLAGSLLTYDLIRMILDNFTHRRYFPPLHIGRDGWRNCIAVCTVFLLLDALFYQASFMIIIYKGRTLDR